MRRQRSGSSYTYRKQYDSILVVALSQMKWLIMLPIIWASAQASTDSSDQVKTACPDSSDDMALLAVETKLTERRTLREPPMVCRQFFLIRCNVSAVPSSFDAMRGIFQGCCQAGGHPQLLCEQMANEGFDMHRGDTFSTASQERLCTEMENLGQSHDGWRKDKVQLTSGAALAEDMLDAAANYKSFNSYPSGQSSG